MEKKIIEENRIRIAVVQSDDLIITDALSALDFISDIQYHDDCDRLAIYKESIIEDFFRLNTGLAGDILQKFINYSKKLAIIGDFSGYTSKALRDFIYECNHGKDIFFVATEEDAIEKLSTAA